MSWIVEKKGAVFEVRAICSDRSSDTSIVDEYIKQQPEELQAKVYGAIAYAADHGPPKHNKEKCRPLGDGIFELKEGSARIPFFYQPGNVMVLTHGFTKRRGKTPPGEIERARRSRADYEEEVSNSDR